MTPSLHPFRSSLRARMMAVVLLSGLTVLAINTLAAAWIVRSDKEAGLTSTAMQQGSELSHHLERTLALSEAQLTNALLSAAAGRPLEAREVVGSQVLALEIRTATGESRLAAATSAALGERLHAQGEDVPAGALIEAPADATGADAPVAVVRVARDDLRGIALVDLRPVLATVPAGCSPRLLPRRAAAHEGVVATRTRVGDRDGVGVTVLGPRGPAVTFEATLAPARVVAHAVLWRMGLAALFSVLPLLALATWFARRLSAPIVALARAVDATETDEPVVIPPVPPDEIGRLAEAIHQSSQRLAWGNNHLRQAVRFARSAASADDSRTIMLELNRALQKNLRGDSRWHVIRKEDLERALADAPELKDELDALLQMERTALLPALDEESGPLSVFGFLAKLGGFAADVPEIAVVPIRGAREHYGVILGVHIDSAATGFAVLFVRVASAALDRRGLVRQAMVTEKMAALGRLAGSIAHEINNPLSYVLANVETLTYELSGEQGEIAQDALQGATRVKEIVRDVSLLAKGGQTTEESPEELGPIVLSALEQSRRRSPGVTIPEPTRRPAPVRGSARRIEQIIVNLVNNAADATLGCEDPRVDVELGIQGRRAVVWVRDNGSGVPEDLRDRLFEPFFTGKGDRGTGLGLYLARTFARVHGGDIELVRTSPAGTVFLFWLPLREMSSPGFLIDDAPSGSKTLREDELKSLRPPSMSVPSVHPPSMSSPSMQPPSEIPPGSAAGGAT